MKTIADLMAAVSPEIRVRVEVLALRQKKDVADVVVSLLSKGAITYPNFLARWVLSPRKTGNPKR